LSIIIIIIKLNNQNVEDDVTITQEDLKYPESKTLARKIPRLCTGESRGQTVPTVAFRRLHLS
jgi:hypothetical protein